jgi:hypothetical protein
MGIKKTEIMSGKISVFRKWNDYRTKKRWGEGK